MIRWPATLAPLLFCGLAAVAQAQVPAFILRVEPGGTDPGRACQPRYSLQNWTGQDLDRFDIELEWRIAATGESLSDGGGLRRISPFATGQTETFPPPSWPLPCGELELAVGGYRCETAGGVRQPCPGLIRVEAAPGVEVDRRGAREGAVR